MKKRIMFLMLMVIAISIQAQTMRNDEMTRRIDEVFGAVYNNPAEPGAAVLIMQGNDTLYSRCFGVADMVTREPVTFETNFCIASVSKQFSAVALLQLAEQGKLSLKDPLFKFFPEFKAVVVPARHAYSHWASVGRSNVNPVFSCNFPMKDVASTAWP